MAFEGVAIEVIGSVNGATQDLAGARTASARPMADLIAGRFHSGLSVSVAPRANLLADNYFDTVLEAINEC